MLTKINSWIVARWGEFNTHIGIPVILGAAWAGLNAANAHEGKLALAFGIVGALQVICPMPGKSNG